MNLSDLKAARAVAGQRYRAARTEFLAAQVDLAALDAVLANSNVNPGDPHPPRTFAKLVERHQTEHPEFAPDEGAHHMGDAVTATRDKFISEFMKG